MHDARDPYEQALLDRMTLNLDNIERAEAKVAAYPNPAVRIMIDAAYERLARSYAELARWEANYYRDQPRRWR